MSSWYLSDEAIQKRKEALFEYIAKGLPHSFMKYRAMSISWKQEFHLWWIGYIDRGRRM